MLRLGRLLLIVLIAAIPLQGAAAASRFLCMADSHHGLAGAVAQTHPHGDAAHAAHDHPGAEHAVATADAAHGHAAGTAPGDSTACNLCAACCVTGASPPARAEPPAMAASSSGFPPVIAVAADFLAHGLERPPRLA